MIFGLARWSALTSHHHGRKNIHSHEEGRYQIRRTSSACLERYRLNLCELLVDFGKNEMVELELNLNLDLDSTLAPGPMLRKAACGFGKQRLHSP
jgi:hypothetical protein